ncbi:hypothetical protein GCM10009605_17850 [Nocardiopsis composta]
MFPRAARPPAAPPPLPRTALDAANRTAAHRATDSPDVWPTAPCRRCKGRAPAVQRCGRLRGAGKQADPIDDPVS